jgi:cytoskeleton protein RodZ
MTVTSTPPGARVTVDGIGWGETPITIREVPGGRKVVRVTKDGYESQQQIVSIPDDRRAIEVRITLAARN